MIYTEFHAVKLLTRFTVLFLENISVSLEQRGSCLKLPPGTGQKLG